MENLVSRGCLNSSGAIDMLSLPCICCAETSASIDKSVHLEMGIPAPGKYMCTVIFSTN